MVPQTTLGSASAVGRLAPSAIVLIGLLGASCGPSNRQRARPTGCPPGSYWNGQQCLTTTPGCPPGAIWNGTGCTWTTPQSPSPHGVPFELPIPVETHVSTVAGMLVFQEVESWCRYSVALGNRVILATNCKDSRSPFSEFPIPAVLKHFGAGPAPFDEVVVLQQRMIGNACNGGPLWFLGLRRDGSYQVSTPIDFCGGKDPVVRPEAGRITIFVPGGPPNRGEGYIPSETWAFQDGNLTKIASGP